MKKLVLLVIFIAVVLCTGCASKDESKKSEVTVEAPVDISGPAFDDWRYKGFGKEIPLWFFYAFEDDIAGVVESRNDLSEADIPSLEIFTGDALNADQAEKLILQFLESHDCGCVDTFWAKLCDESEFEGNPYRWIIIAIN